MSTSPTRRASLRLRFSLAISLWVVLGIGAIWYSAVQVFASHVEQSYHEELEVHVNELARLTRIGTDGQPELTRPLSDPRYEVPLSGFYWQVTAEGKRTLKSDSMTRGSLDQQVAHAPQIAHEVEAGPTGPAITYGFIKPGPNGENVHFVIATDQAELDRVINGFTRDLTLWLIALGAVLLATGIAFISFGLRPLSRLTRDIGQLRAGKIDQLEGSYPSEIAPLVFDLNDYIRQTGDMIARARVQAGNLAHSLRTPLAVVMDEAERLSERGEGAQSAQVLLDQAHMMEQQIEYQLARARSSSGIHVPGSVSRLPELILPIFNAMHRLHPDKSFHLADGDSESLALAIDPIDLSELISILLDNAGKWARESVSLSCSRSPAGCAVIHIEDDGPGMTEAQIAAAFDIGSRFDYETPGSGLGLAIARDICENLGVALTLAATGHGLRAEIRIPASTRS